MKSKKRITHNTQLYQYLVGLRFGSLFSAIVAFAWMGFLAQNLNDYWQIRILPSITFVVVVFVMWWVIDLVKNKVPRTTLPSHFASGTFWVVFWSIIVAEVVILYGLISFLQAQSYPQAMWPLLVIVIALHWIPLGRLNGVKEWYLIATVLICAEVLMLLLFSPLKMLTTFGVASYAWETISIVVMIIVMLCSALWLKVKFVRAYRRLE